MNPKQLRELVVRPVLDMLGLHSQSAEDLIMGTAAQESRFEYIRQLGNGPARGLFQMEPATHTDIWDNWLAYKPDLASRVRGLASQHWFLQDPDRELIGNVPYACALCRIHYRRVPEALPAPGDIEGYGRYWKQYYNTPLGAGTVEEYVENYRRYLE